MLTQEATGPHMSLPDEVDLHSMLWSQSSKPSVHSLKSAATSTTAITMSSTKTTMQLATTTEQQQQQHQRENEFKTPMANENMHS